MSDKNYCPDCGAFLPSESHKPMCDVHGPAIQALIEKWLLAYQRGEAKPGDCKGIVDNLLAEARQLTKLRAQKAISEAVCVGIGIPYDEGGAAAVAAVRTL